MLQQFWTISINFQQFSTILNNSQQISEISKVSDEHCCAVLVVVRGRAQLCCARCCSWTSTAVLCSVLAVFFWNLLRLVEKSLTMCSTSKYNNILCVQQYSMCAVSNKHSCTHRVSISRHLKFSKKSRIWAHYLKIPKKIEDLSSLPQILLRIWGK